MHTLASRSVGDPRPRLVATRAVRSSRFDRGQRLDELPRRGVRVDDRVDATAVEQLDRSRFGPVGDAEHAPPEAVQLRNQTRASARASAS